MKGSTAAYARGWRHLGKSEIPGPVACLVEKKELRKLLAFALAANLVFFAVAVLAQGKPPLRLLQTIPLPDLQGGDFDHFAADPSGKRLFVAAEANNAVEVFDLSTNQLAHTIRGVDTPHSLVYLPAAMQLWVVSGGDGTVKVFDATNYSLIQTIKLALGADASAYDPAKHLMYVVTAGEDAKMGFSLISIVDTETRQHVGDIKVDSTNIEAIAIQKNGPMLFANVRDRGVVGVIDREKRMVVSTWQLGEVRRNTPMALDEANRRLFVVGRKPAELVVLDSDSGRIITSLPTAEIADDVAFDPASKRIYVACDASLVVYLQRDADRYEELARFPTGFRAKTAILVPQLKRFYVAAPRHSEKIAELRVYEVQ